MEQRPSWSSGDALVSPRGRPALRRSRPLRWSPPGQSLGVRNVVRPSGPPRLFISPVIGQEVAPWHGGCCSASGPVAVASSGLFPQPLWINVRSACGPPECRPMKRSMSRCAYVDVWMLYVLVPGCRPDDRGPALAGLRSRRFKPGFEKDRSGVFFRSPCHRSLTQTRGSLSSRSARRARVGNARPASARQSRADDRAV